MRGDARAVEGARSPGAAEGDAVQHLDGQHRPGAARQLQEAVRAQAEDVNPMAAHHER